MKKRALVILLIVVISIILQLTIADNLILSNCNVGIYTNDSTNTSLPIYIVQNIQPLLSSEQTNAAKNGWINFISLSDGMNTHFIIRELNTKYTKVKLTIYNSWGKRVFQSNNYQNDFDARKYPEGTYYYQAYYTLKGVNIETCKNSFFEVRD